MYSNDRQGIALSKQSKFSQNNRNSTLKSPAQKPARHSQGSDVGSSLSGNKELSGGVGSVARSNGNAPGRKDSSESSIIDSTSKSADTLSPLTREEKVRDKAEATGAKCGGETKYLEDEDDDKFAENSIKDLHRKSSKCTWCCGEEGKEKMRWWCEENFAR